MKGHQLRELTKGAGWKGILSSLITIGSDGFFYPFKNKLDGLCKICYNGFAQIAQVLGSFIIEK